MGKTLEDINSHGLSIVTDAPYTFKHHDKIQEKAQ